MTRRKVNELKEIMGNFRDILFVRIIYNVVRRKYSAGGCLSFYFYTYFIRLSTENENVGIVLNH